MFVYPSFTAHGNKDIEYSPEVYDPVCLTTPFCIKEIPVLDAITVSISPVEYPPTNPVDPPIL